MGFGVVLPVARRQAEAALLSTNLSDAVPLAVAGDSETPASSCLTFRIQSKDFLRAHIIQRC